MKFFPTGGIWPTRTVENTDGRNHELRLDFSEFLRLRVPELECVVLLLLVPYCGDELVVEFDVWFNVVLLGEAFPVIFDLVTGNKEAAPIRVRVGGETVHQVNVVWAI